MERQADNQEQIQITPKVLFEELDRFVKSEDGKRVKHAVVVLFNEEGGTLFEHTDGMPNTYTAVAAGLCQHEFSKAKLEHHGLGGVMAINGKDIADALRGALGIGKKASRDAGPSVN